MTPQVSIVLNSYNQAAFLAEALESVLAQSFADFELIAADNGSTDESPEIIERYARRDSRVRPFLHRTNDRISRRFNQSISSARGEFVSFLYSDDYYLPGKLERQVRLFGQLPNDYGVVHGPALGKNEITGATWQFATNARSGLVLESLLDTNHLGAINMLSPMTRLSLLRRYPFHEDIFTEGEFWFFRAAMLNKFYFDAEPVVVLRDHGKNAGKAVSVNVDMTCVAIAHIANEPDFPDSARPALRRFHARILRNGAWSTLRTGGDVEWARNAFRSAVDLRSATLLHPRFLMGFPMTFIPTPIRALANRFANRVRQGPANVSLVQDFRHSA